MALHAAHGVLADLRIDRIVTSYVYHDRARQLKPREL